METTHYNIHSKVQHYLAHKLVDLCWYEHFHRLNMEKQLQPFPHSENRGHTKKTSQNKNYEQSRPNQNRKLPSG